MAHVGGRDPVAKFKRRDADQQVRERQTDTECGILPIDLTGSKCH